MYIFECIWKWLFPKKLSKEYDYNPLAQPEDFDDNPDECEHEFMPVDSTGETLACIKCGFIVKLNGNNITKD
ncbi:MAG: hypothetical protein NC200_08055 [Candidatus Gastranaerophilales bacterium]|nr:hypothetical protein [Candidatus Gastranaerophilales bacterium]